MLKKIRLSEVLAKKIFRADGYKIVRSISSSKANKITKSLSKSEKSKNNNSSKNLTHILSI